MLLYFVGTLRIPTIHSYVQTLSRPQPPGDPLYIVYIFGSGAATQSSILGPFNLIDLEMNINIYCMHCIISWRP